MPKASSFEIRIGRAWFGPEQASSYYETLCMKDSFKKKHRKPAKRKRQRPGKVATAIAKLDKLYTAGTAKRFNQRTGEERALITFITEHQQPYKERGDQYLSILTELLTLLPHDQQGEGSETLYRKFHAMRTELEDLQVERATRLNYDDIRSALLGVVEAMAPVRSPVPEWFQKVLKALAGAPVSDVGLMRTALTTTDHILTGLLKSFDESMPRSVVTLMWELVHRARKALVATLLPDAFEIMTGLYRKASEIANKSEYETLPERVGEIVEERNDAFRKLALIANAVIANDPTAAVITKGGDLIDSAYSLIMEAISLRAFLAEERVLRLTWQQAAQHLQTVIAEKLEPEPYHKDLRRPVTSVKEPRFEIPCGSPGEEV